MSHTEALALLAGLGTLALLLPLLPLVRTLARGAPTQPLAEDTPDLATQAATFQRMVSEQFGHLLHLARESGPIRGANENGSPFIVLGVANHLAEQLPPGSRHLRSLVLAAGHLDIPGELICDRELFAEGRINIAHDALVRGALSSRDIAVGRYARVTRWVRSARRIDVAEAGQIRGWAGAVQEITLARRCRFEHLRAPRILFGRQPETRLQHQADSVGRFDPPARNHQQPGNGRNLKIPPGHAVKSNLLVSGRLVVGDNCHIIGDLRADKSIVIGSNVIIEGAVFADGPISIGSGCAIAGPVRSPEEVHLGFHCEIGTQAAPSTLMAGTLLISEGCVAYGSVRALRHGEVITDERAAQ